MFFDTKQRVLAVIATVFFLLAGAATIARLNRKPDLNALPPEIRQVVPLEKPTNIELFEDDAGIGK